MSVGDSYFLQTTVFGPLVSLSTVALPNISASFKSQRKPSPSDNLGKKAERKLINKRRARRGKCLMHTALIRLQPQHHYIVGTRLKRDQTSQ